MFEDVLENVKRLGSDDDDEIRAFLASPRSIEMMCDANASINSNPPDVAVKTRRRAKNRKLPPYIPYKSIFVETDYGRLTERQKILAIKFQTMSRAATSMFLAVNEINEGDLSAMAFKVAEYSDQLQELRGFLEWAIARHSCPVKRRIKRLLTRMGKRIEDRETLVEIYKAAIDIGARVCCCIGIGE